jgi:hypothetical protein
MLINGGYMDSPAAAVDVSLWYSLAFNPIPLFDILKPFRHSLMEKLLEELQNDG